MKPLATLLLMGVIAMTAQANEDLKPYAAAEEGYQRMVFRLPALEDESSSLVEILVGKTMEVDCNRVLMRGELEEHSVEGWGYPYYTARIAPHHATTLMACPPGAAKQEQFVAAAGDGFKVRYNSQLPVVVYAPQGYEVRYRIWRAGDAIERAAVE